MTFAKYFTTSTIKSDVLVSLDASEISGVLTAHFYKDSLNDTSVTSTNNYQFTLSSASGSSFMLEGSMLVNNTGTNVASANFRFYDETNSQFIGTIGKVTNKIDSSAVDPAYPTTAIAMILASDFGGSDITVSLRAISTSGAATYPGTIVGSNNGRILRAILKIQQT